ncbi:diaminobutyrate acetyltransferase [Paramicrobacterium humi]|uniref:L-2,4-diaminobutyric acid acetyltransferase n=1 Tax=Paramicrobacterium humi TaxID=640635 RepID=A0A1H4K0U8_9MICO|nr:diaminobutyrate acetyltransferase [Microbacterium humi]SEB52043.1 diaminobutyrate acetyltransferase [Microbacterium humi]
MSVTEEITPVHDVETPPGALIVEPEVRHAAEMWRVARDSKTLDVNSSYAYLVYCRDFARTSRVAVIDGRVVGFVIGHVRPESPHHLFVWQIAVDESARGKGLAGRLLDELFGAVAASDDVHSVETTITDDNEASQKLFASFAKRWQKAPITVDPLFEPAHFPDGHDAEKLYEIGPIFVLDDGIADDARELVATEP